MKSGALAQLVELESTLRRIRAIAETLPESGPTPVIYLQCGGELRFHNAHQLLPAFLAFGSSDWRVTDKEGSARKDFTKKLANGVQIVVENAMSGESAHLTINV